MPRPFVPHRSPSHRLACVSLYRDLLKECQRFSAEVENTSGHGVAGTLRSLVQYRFRKDKTLTSLRAIDQSFSAGDDTLNLLRACTSKSKPALDTLAKMLEALISKAEGTAAVRERDSSFWKPPPPIKYKHMEHIRRLSRKDLQRSTPGVQAVFQRPKPLSEITGDQRKVPVYMVSNGIPVLKYPGPQPVLMNRVIRQKWKWNTKQQEKLDRLQEGAYLAETEDDWDRLLRIEHGIDETDNVLEKKMHGSGRYLPGRDSRRPVTWDHSLLSSFRAVQAGYNARAMRYTIMGEKLYKVLQDERELKEKERRSAKHERRMARKRAQGFVQLSAGLDEGGVDISEAISDPDGVKAQ